MNNYFPGQSYSVFLFVMILFILFWIYSLLWVAKDISWRTNSLRFQVFCIVLIAFTTPLIGLPVYFLMRPVQRFDTKKVVGNTNIPCQSCAASNDPTHEYCTSCGDKLTHSCIGCQKSIPVTYVYCPYCGAARSTVLSD